MCICTILLTCNLFSFNADVNWLPASNSPYDFPGSQYYDFIIYTFSFDIMFIFIDCIDQWKLINRTRSLLFQISVARSVSEDGFQGGLENTYGFQCYYNNWLDAETWTLLEYDNCNH